MRAQAVQVVFAGFFRAGDIRTLIQFALPAIIRRRGTAIDCRNHPLGALAEVPAEQARALPRRPLACFALLPVARVGAIEIP